MDPSRRLAAQLRDMGRRVVSLEQVTVTAVSPLRVEGADGDVELRALGWYDPAVGDQVTVLRMGGTGLVLGATTANQRPSGTGTVSAYTGGAATVTVTVDGIAYVVPKSKTWAPVVGETCAVMWSPVVVSGDVQWSGVGICGLATSASSTVVPKTSSAQEPASIPPSVADSSVRVTIPATACGTWRGGWRTDTGKVVQGTYNSRTNSGYWFYGSQMAAYRDVTLTKAEIYLHASTGGAGAATAVKLFTHGSTKKTSTQPTAGSALGTPSLADNAKGWYPLTLAVAQGIVDGTVHGVAAISALTADYTTLCGLAGDEKDPLSGALRITGERT